MHAKSNVVCEPKDVWPINTHSHIATPPFSHDETSFSCYDLDDALTVKFSLVEQWRNSYSISALWPDLQPDHGLTRLISKPVTVYPSSLRMSPFISFHSKLPTFTDTKWHAMSHKAALASDQAQLLLPIVSALCIRIVTLPYYRLYHFNTKDPISKIAVIASEQPRSFRLLCAVTLWRARKLTELQFISIAVSHRGEFNYLPSKNWHYSVLSSPLQLSVRSPGPPSKKPTGSLTVFGTAVLYSPSWEFWLPLSKLRCWVSSDHCHRLKKPGKLMCAWIDIFPCFCHIMGRSIFRGRRWYSHGSVHWCLCRILSARFLLD